MITAQLNGQEMPPLEVQFLNQNIENAVDVETLDASVYTDFVSNDLAEWTFNYAKLTEAQYDALRAIYDSQFTLFQYPVLTIPYYNTDSPVRMYINTKDIWNNCGSVQNVQIRFRETRQLGGGSS